MNLIADKLRSNRKDPMPVHELYALVYLAQDGDIESRNKIIEANLGLIFRAIKHMPYLNESQREEAFQNGTIGMIRSVELFDPKKGFAFSTYADWWIRQSIGRAHDTDDHMIQFPVHVLETQRLLNRLRVENPNMQDDAIHKKMARSMGRSLERIQNACAASRNLVNVDAESHDGDKYIDIEAPSITDPWSFELDDLNTLLSKLDKRSARILVLRSEKKTLCSIAARFKISRERVRQLEAMALKKLRKLVQTPASNGNIRKNILQKETKWGVVNGRTCLQPKRKNQKGLIKCS